MCDVIQLLSYPYSDNRLHAKDRTFIQHRTMLWVDLILLRGKDVLPMAGGYTMS
jgi:hypothetical protein